MTEEPSEPPKESKKPKQEPSSAWDSLEEPVTWIGKLAWIILLVAAILEVVFAIVNIARQVATNARLASLIPSYTPTYRLGFPIWQIIGGIISILFCIIIVRPRFSKKCGDQDWDFLLNDVLKLGNFRFPWMFVWAIIATIFGWYWGGAAIWFPAIILVVAGPKPYKWTEE
ncbi:MAG: hypothetical protein EU543_05855 [Promethearchaeota archaeon]|nr:MAG: hypothetical protein EU543_05855 [Candidatus Lokiarchaeota archaeon]